MYVEADNNTDTLSKFRGTKHYKAKNGQPGGAGGVVARGGGRILPLKCLWGCRF